MVVLYSLPVLDDAFFFLNQAKGMPDLPRSKMRDLYIRTSILFSWVALEEAIASAADEMEQLPRRLGDRLQAILLARGNNEFRLEEFLPLRSVRDSITHPRVGAEKAVSPALEQAVKTFDYCSAMIGRLSPWPVVWGDTGAVHERIQEIKGNRRP
jgi:hypothetical protein